MVAPKDLVTGVAWLMIAKKTSNTQDSPSEVIIGLTMGVVETVVPSEHKLHYLNACHDCGKGYGETLQVITIGMAVLVVARFHPQKALCPFLWAW